MNKKRRAKLACVISKLQDNASILMAIQEEEQMTLDNLPESFAMSEKGEKMEEAVSQLEEAVSQIEDIVQNLEEI